MLAKSKIVDSEERFYLVKLKEPTVIAGKRRSPMHQLRLSGVLTLEHYDSFSEITATQ